MEASNRRTRHLTRPLLEVWLAVRVSVLLGLGPGALLVILSAGLLGETAVGRLLYR